MLLSFSARFDQSLTIPKGFLDEYIRTDWIPAAVAYPVKFGLSDEGFTSGQLTVDGLLLTQPPAFEEGQPAGDGHSNEHARVTQTSDSSNKTWLQKHKKTKQDHELALKESAARHREIERAAPVPNPFSPTMDVYLRPATVTDAQGIANVYNYCKLAPYLPSSYWN